MNRPTQLFLALIYVCCAPMTWASPQTFCSPEENDLFTCSIGRKTVSICSSKDLSRTSGYVQYRFGVSNRDPELVYPVDKDRSVFKFSYGVEGAAKSSLENLQFSLSNNSYTIYEERAAFDTNGAGIIVKTHDGKISRLKCKEERPPGRLFVLHDLGTRQLPAEALVSTESLGQWPAESSNVDLLEGARTHDFALVEWALKNGADVNFHGPLDVGVLGTLNDGRSEAIRKGRVAAFDDETDRLIDLLLAHGASPTITSQSGATVIDFMAGRGAPNRTILRLLDVGWRTDYDYRLYVGARISNATLIKDALEHGADPNKPIRNSRYLVVALLKPCSLSYKGQEAEQEQALAALELLLKAGAKIVQGNRFQGGDITTVYAYDGNQPNIQPVLDLLIRYASTEDKENSLSFLKSVDAKQYPQRQANLEWLIKRLTR